MPWRIVRQGYFVWRHNVFMPSIEFSKDDFDFLSTQATEEGITVGEYLANMTDRQRVLVKYKDQPDSAAVTPRSNLEPPHRKWGM
jgi:hypothetical protein